MRRAAILLFVPTFAACAATSAAPNCPEPEVASGEAENKSAAAESTAKATEPSRITVDSGVHAFTVRDLLAMDRVGAPILSPDGSQVLFTLRSTDIVADRGWSDLYVVPTAGGEPRRLTSTAGAEVSPTWSRDGSHIYYLASTSGSMQVWALPVSGGAPVQVTALPLDVGAFSIAPTGDRLAVSMEVFVDCQDLKCTSERLEKAGKDLSSAQVYDELFVRHWDTWKDGRRSHLFVLPLAQHQASGSALDVTRGMNADVPGKPFGGSEDWSFSPDGKLIAFSARDVGREESWSTNFDIFLAATDGSAAPRKVTSGAKGSDAQPKFSTDGKHLYWLAMERPQYESDQWVLHRAEISGGSAGAPRKLSAAWDRSISEYVPLPGDTQAIVVAQDLGHKRIFALELDSGKATSLVGDGTFGHVDVRGDTMVFTRNDLTQPDDIYRATLSGGALTQLTSVNKERLAQIKFGKAEQFSFKGARGDTVYGWIVEPVDKQEGKSYPVAFLIHGGPQGSFSNNFHYRWNPQTYAGRGYAAIMIDFHGSTGYGQAFTDAIRDDWGGKPLEDLQKGLAHAATKYPWIDTKRACALGASYGGFMINWIAGKWPDGFRCLVNHDGIFDQRSMYYTTEELWFPEWEHGGPYYERQAAYEKHNPALFVKSWKTPMLVVQGGLDFRVPTEQGLATFTALQRRGIESRFMYFPNENHWVLRPNNSLKWHDTVEAWLAKHLDGDRGRP